MLLATALIACAPARHGLEGSPCLSGTYSSVQHVEEAADLYGLELALECTDGRVSGTLKEYSGSLDGAWPVHGTYDPAAQGIVLMGATGYGTVDLVLHRVEAQLEGTATRRYQGGTSEEQVTLQRKE